MNGARDDPDGNLDGQNFDLQVGHQVRQHVTTKSMIIRGINPIMVPFAGLEMATPFWLQ